MYSNTELEECGAGFGQKILNKIKVWVVSLMAHCLCHTLGKQLFPACEFLCVDLKEPVCAPPLRPQTRSRCWWCGTARCPRSSETWTDTARRGSWSQPKWESSFSTTEPRGLHDLVFSLYFPTSQSSTLQNAADTPGPFRSSSSGCAPPTNTVRCTCSCGQRNNRSRCGGSAATGGWLSSVLSSFIKVLSFFYFIGCVTAANVELYKLLVYLHPLANYLS